VATFPAFHTLALIARLAERLVPPLGRLDADGRADVAFDRLVARSLRRWPTASIVHAFEGAALYTLMAARHVGAAAVLDVPSAHEYFHGVAREEGEPVDEEWLASASARVRAERQQADWLLVPSEYVRRCLVENGAPEDHVAYIPYGADPARFAPEAGRLRGSERTFRALFVGRVGARKGVRYLLEAWESLSLPNAELVLAGGAGRSGRELTSRYRTNSRWLGNVPYPSIPRLFQASDIFVFPSLAEGSALVTYEAMSAGLPLVTTINAGSVVRDGTDGFLVAARSSEAIAAKIEWLYEHPRERREMGALARERILNGYTWRHYRARLRCLYRAIHAGVCLPSALEEAEPNGSE